MMNNLFSIFDPSTNILNTPLYWLSTIIGLMFINFDSFLIVILYYEI